MSKIPRPSQNIFSTIFGSKCHNMCSKKFENQLTNKDFIPKINLNKDFDLAREKSHDHKHSILATLLT